MRRRSGSSGFTTSAASRGGCAIRLNIGRVIARPFVGANADDFRAHRPTARTSAMPPLPGNLLQRASRGGPHGRLDRQDRRHLRPSRHRATSSRAASNDGNVDLRARCARETADGGFIFVNLVDFDTEYGHRRDVPGYRRLPRSVRRAAAGDRSGDAADDFCVHHRRPRQRPDLARQRPYPRARADSRLRRRRRAGADRRAHEPRRHRRDDRAQARPAGAGERRSWLA